MGRLTSARKNPAAKRPPFEFGGEAVGAGTRATVDLPVSVLSNHTPMTLPVQVVHGRADGPVLFVSAAVHGDEVLGIEIIRRVLQHRALRALKGTLMAVPIVNALGFINHSRYLPDRRDLNRVFPGSPQGSLASRLAHIFMTEIVGRADVGIDLHSAAIHRSNLPQIRVTPSKPETIALAEVFGAPLVLTSKTRPGSLRQAAQDLGIDVLLYEAGEGLRFDEFAVRAGVTGILRIMHHLKMIPARGITKLKAAPIQSSSSFWQRAPAGGLLRAFKTIGDEVEEGDVLGIISDPFGEMDTEILAEEDGLIIGRSNLPVANEGDGLFHIARLRRHDDAGATIDSLANQLNEDPLFDEDEII